MQNIIRQSENNTQLPYQWLGTTDYTPFLAKMHKKAEEVIARPSAEMVYFCEHHHVYTTGRRGINNSKVDLGAPLIQTERGGETTYHGIGQLMMYPIIHLKQRQLSVRQYVHLLEQSCIDLLAQHHIQADRDCGLPGVWIKKQKIAALGIRVSQGVCSHGIALNVSTDLSWFDKINPCGTTRKATSLEQQLSHQHTPFDMQRLSQQWHQIFTGLLK